MKSRHIIWSVALILGLAVVFSFYLFDLGRFFTLASVQSNAAWLADYARNHPILCVFLYVTVFSAVLAFSLPVTSVLTLLGGFLFGVVPGALYATAGATIGATIAFLVFRHGIGQIMRTGRAKRLETLNKQLKAYGVPYLLLLQFSALDIFQCNVFPEPQIPE